MDPAGGTDVVYRERLWPSPGVWLASVGCAAALGLVVLPLSRWAAVAVAVAAPALVIGALVVTSARVDVSSRALHAGRAGLDVEFVGPVEPLDAAAMRIARGTGLDARAYLCIRGWIPGGVRVHVLDAADPTPYWLVSSRSPTGLAAALDAVRQAGRR